MNNFQYNKYLYFNNNLLGANSFINQNNERNFNNPSSNTNNTNFIETQTEKVSNPHVARENSNINTNVLSENHLQQNVNMEPQKFPNSYNNPYEGQIGNEQMEHHINNHIDHNLAQPYSIPNHNYRINDQQANADNYNSSYNTSNYLNQNKSLTPYGERLRMAGNNIFR